MSTATTLTSKALTPIGEVAPRADAERVRWRRHPISRFYLCPLADLIARHAGRIGATPVHFTVANLLLASAAAASLAIRPSWSIAAAAMIALAWLSDRIDGMLARRQQTASTRGAWLDANVDELCDVLLHVGVAAAAVANSGTSTGWLLVLAFVAGKYLYSFSVHSEAGMSPSDLSDEVCGADSAKRQGWLRKVYHLMGNADVRLHLLVAACLLQCWTA